MLWSNNRHTKCSRLYNVMYNLRDVLISSDKQCLMNDWKFEMGRTRTPYLSPGSPLSCQSATTPTATERAYYIVQVCKCNYLLGDLEVRNKILNEYLQLALEKSSMQFCWFCWASVQNSSNMHNWIEQQERALNRNYGGTGDMGFCSM